MSCGPLVLPTPVSVMAMIDWLTCRIAVKLPAPIAGGWTVVINPDGSEQRRTPHRLSVGGSFEASLTIRAVVTDELELSGNLAKFLQGHNLWGPSDPAPLLWAALERLQPHLGATLPEIGLRSLEDLKTATTLSRGDCTSMLQFDTPGDVLAFLRAAEATGRVPRRGKGVFKGATVVYGDATGKTFTRWQIVLYSKGQEITAHPLPGFMMEDTEVLDWTNKCLRVETRLGRNELRERGLRSLSAWSAATCAEMWREKVGMLSFNEAVVDETADLAKLPDHLRGTYAQWKLGQDLRKSMTKAKFYRHRRLIQGLTGIDIAVLPPSPATASVVPIKRVLEARLVGRPPWADRVDRQLRDAGAIVLHSAA